MSPRISNIKVGDGSIASTMQGVVAVQGACVKSVNGVYRFAGISDGVGKFTKEGVWQGKLVTFTLYRCKHQDSSARWYISIPYRRNCPGTRNDIDLFSALANTAVCPCTEAPPEQGWKGVVGSGLASGSAPMCLWISSDSVSGQQETIPLMCVVCLEQPVSHVFVPCGHPCLCSNCAVKISWCGKRCPVARCKIGSVMKIYGTIVEKS